jgi:hypothetical protein
MQTMQAFEFNSVVHNGIIKMPLQYRNVPLHSVKVIVLSQENSASDAKQMLPTIEKRKSALKRLIGLTKDNPVSIEEARAERLARQ